MIHFKKQEKFFSDFVRFFYQFESFRLRRMSKKESPFFGKKCLQAWCLYTSQSDGLGHLSAHIPKAATMRLNTPSLRLMAPSAICETYEFVVSVRPASSA